MRIGEGAPAAGGSRHSVQFFDRPKSLSAAVAAFVREGLSTGDHVLIVMKPELWNLTAATLDRADVSLADAIASGRLTVFDSRRTLQRLLVHGVPDADLFEQNAGALVRLLTSRHMHLRMYGDMVDLLAADGEFEAAQRLEAFWNRLGEQHSFVLFCGYLAGNFSSARNASALREICRLHDRVHPTPDDILSSHLLDSLGT